jgi:tetratricopeptide (TPR) repeat protein
LNSQVITRGWFWVITDIVLLTMAFIHLSRESVFFVRGAVVLLLVLFLAEVGALCVVFRRQDKIIEPSQSLVKETGETELRHAIRLNPDDLESRYLLARLLDKSGRPKEAAVEFERILNISDQEPDVHFAFGDLLLRMGDRQKARQHFEEALRLYPPSSPWRQRIEALLKSMMEEHR